MVTTDISRLNAESVTWKNNLRNLKAQITQCQQRLAELVSLQLPKNALEDIEHFQNQFDIQLFNIHDVKQAIKENERKAGWENGSLKRTSDQVWTSHEDLYQQYLHLDHTLRELQDDFNGFIHDYA